MVIVRLQEVSIGKCEKHLLQKEQTSQRDLWTEEDLCGQESLENEEGLL